MKKVFLFMVLAVVCGRMAVSQTSLYKQMCGVRGITASCIENCPIGDNDSVSVTMLEADDTATFNRLMKDLKKMEIIHEPILRSKFLNQLSINFITKRMMEDDSTQIIRSTRPIAKTMTTSLMLGRSMTDTDELVVLYGVVEQQTALVFHCKDEEEVGQVLAYVCRLWLANIKSMSEE
ncbi:MAG: hypothetical protein MJZ99_05520 [Bacteroidales bacterium]|nr:hypothetical protein [Bacteroidales bacterium]